MNLRIEFSPPVYARWLKSRDPHQDVGRQPSAADNPLAHFLLHQLSEWHQVPVDHVTTACARDQPLAVVYLRNATFITRTEGSGTGEGPQSISEAGLYDIAVQLPVWTAPLVRAYSNAPLSDEGHHPRTAAPASESLPASAHAPSPVPQPVTAGAALADLASIIGRLLGSKREGVLSPGDERIASPPPAEGQDSSQTRDLGDGPEAETSSGSWDANHSATTMVTIRLSLVFSPDEYAGWLLRHVPAQALGMAAPGHSVDVREGNDLETFIEEHVTGLFGVTTYLAHGAPKADLHIPTMVLVRTGTSSEFRSKSYGDLDMTFDLPGWTASLVSRLGRR